MRSLISTLLILSSLCGCRGVRRAAPLTPPVVTLELQNLTDAERRVLVRFMEGTASRRWRVDSVAGREASMNRDDDASSLVYRVHLNRWTEHEELHRQLINLRAMPDNHQILQNHNARASLAYTSSQAQSHSLAIVTIAVAPAEAELHFDTRVPRGLAATIVKNGRYQLKLPFSFIRSHDYIYFHSVYKGQYRYYRYHLQNERQELLPGIDSPQAMARYLQAK